jgi:FMN-dependent NADH-azoreductase
MKTILQINASIHSANGESSRLASDFAAQLRERNPGAELIVRDLARDPVPHLDAKRFSAFVQKAELRDEEQKAVVRYSDALIEELRRADTIVLGLPMYNFGVPSQLKAWFDHVARAGVTFKYTAQGAAGLLAGKRVYVLATRGGKYAGTGADHETPFVRQFLAFLGITEVEFVYAEGLAMGEAPKRDGLAAARRVASGFVEELRIAA